MVIRSSIDNILIATNGTNGQPGTPGTSSYIHIKYSNDGGQTFTANDGETIGAYIGIYKDYTEADSSSVSDYQWKKIEGEDGEPAYTIMLSNENFSISTDTSYVPIHTQNFTCNVTMLKGSSPADFTITASTDTENDIVTTVNGHTVTIAVAPVEALSVPQGVITLTIATTDGQDTHTFTKDITWSVSTQGRDGQSGSAGVSIDNVVNYYLITIDDNPVTKEDSGWSTTIQSMTEHYPYLWTYEDIIGSDGSTISSTEPMIIGRYGRDGAAAAEGRGILSITEHYQVSDSNTIPPETWSDTPVTTDNTNKYLWNYETILYTDNTSEDTQKRVIGTHGTPGTNGTNGTSVTVSSTTIDYAISASATQAPTDESEWGELKTATEEKPYLWTRTNVVFSDNTTTTSYSVSRQGIDGVNGQDGKPGKDGKDGTSTYVHIKYSDVANPTDADLTETPSDYIGICHDSNLADPTTASSYTWSKWQGHDGKNGQPGAKGEDGTNSYIHFAYSTSSDGSQDFSPSSFDGALYIGILVDDILEDSTDYTDYEWSLIKGEDGTSVEITSTSVQYAISADGVNTPAASEWKNAIPATTTEKQYLWTKTVVNYSDNTSTTSYSVARQGIDGMNGQDGQPGTNGKDGTSTYVHIKYSAVANPTDSDMTETPSDYIGICHDSNVDDPTTASSYAWSKWLGEDGKDGTPGKDGTNGKSSYTHFAYANSADGSEDFSTSSFAGAKYIGIRVDEVQADSTRYQDYTWNLIKGEDGDSITVTSTEYKEGTSPTTVPTGSWSTTPVTVSEGNYLWTRVTYSDGKTSYSVAKQGVSGTSVTVTKTEYAYQLSTSGTEIPTGTWKTTPQAPTITQYAWTRTTTTFSDGSTAVTYTVGGKVGEKGSTGDNGRGIVSITEYFLLSATDDSSKITFPEQNDKHGWTTVGEGLVWSKAKPVLWHCTEVVYENPDGTRDYEYIDKYPDTGWKAADLVQENLTNFQQGVDNVIDRDNQSIRSAVWENTYTYKPKKDAQGNYIYDEHGKIVPDTDNTKTMSQYMAEQIVDMDGVTIRVASAEADINGIDDRVSTAESTITQHATDIEAKVSKDGVIAAINLSTETDDGGSAAKISANKVEINGTAIFNAIKDQLDDEYDASNSLVSITTLYYASNSTTAPTKPSSHITTNNNGTYGKWNIALPTFNESYPYLYTCKELKTRDGSYLWTSVEQTTYNSAISSIKSTADAASPKTSAIARSQRIYYRKTTSGAPAKNTTWLASSGTGYGNWSLNIPQLTDSNGTKYLYLYTAVQTQTVAQQAAGTACTCSDVLIDDTATIIDGGTIITGTVTAREITTDNLQGDHGWINLKDGKFYYGDESTFTASDNAISWNGSKLQIKADEFLLASGKSIFDEIEAIETWFYATAPTTSNAPASSWTTDNLKEMHLRDIYFDTNSGKSYRWAKEGTTYKWVEIEDKELSALAGRVATAETNISTNSEQIALRATKTEIANTYATKDSVPTSVTDLSDADNYATKDYADEAADTAEANAKADTTTKLQSYYTKTETDSAISQTAEGITTRVTKLETRSVGNYATSSTGAGTIAKVATIVPAVTGWELYKGAVMTVKFTAANTASAPTLNVNSTGAKPIKTYSGGNLSEAEYKWDAGTTMSFVYDDTNWRIQDSSELTRLKSAETNISQNAEAIALRATKTEAQGYATTAETNAKNDTTNKLKSYSTTTEMNAAIEAKADEITSSVSTTYAIKTSVPTKTSDLENDSDFATESYADGKASSAESAAKTYADGKASDAETAAKGYADTQIGTAKTEIKQTTDNISSRVTKTEAKISGHYATSSTAAGTAAKAATITPTTSDWELYTGASVTVKFTYANTTASPTLNVNSKGAKAIKSYTGANLSEAEYKWAANATITFVYNGSNWLMQDGGTTARISSAETTIQQTANNVLIKATQNDTTATQGGQHIIESLINVAPEGIKISADKVNIDGTAIFTNEDFQTALNNQGYQTADNVNNIVEGKGYALNSDLTTEINQRKAQYGTCSTDAGTADKVVACANFELVAGNEITVKFSKANTSSALIRLIVDGKDAKNVWVANAVTSATNQLLWGANAYITFRYDGTQFIVIGEPRTWYGASTTGAGTAAKTDTTAVTGCVICKGTKVELAMTNNNTVASPTLNIRSTGAKRIYYGTSTNAPTVANGHSWIADTTATFTFDGQYWRMAGQTVINGDNITTGTIDANRITASVISAVNSSTETSSGSSLKISADKVNIEGAAIFTTGGRLSQTSLDNAYDAKGAASAAESNAKTYADEAVNNLQIGGRNLLRNTKDFAEATYTSTCTFAKDSEGITVITFPAYTGSVGWRGVTLHPNIPYTLIRDKTVTLSFWYRSDSWTLASGGNNYPIPSFEILANATDNPSGTARLKYKTIDDSTVPAPTTEWQRFVRTYNITDSFFTAGSGTVTEDRYFTIQMFQHNLSHLQYKKIQLEIGNKVTDWTPAPEDVESIANGANAQEQLIYISKATGTTSVLENKTWVIDATGNQNVWTTKRPEYSKSYPVLFVATQRQTVSQSSGTYCTCTTPMIDDTTTVIDGGNIITGTVTANKLNAADINASKTLTIGAFQEDTQEDILNSNVQIGGRNLLYDTNAPSLVPTGIGGGIRYFSNATSLSTNGNGTEWTALPDKPIPEIEYGVKHVCTKTGGQNHLISFYQGADRIDFIPGRQYTVSYWAKSSVSGAIVSIGLAGNTEWDRNTRYDYTIQDVDTWERVSVTFTYLGTSSLTEYNQQNTVLYLGFQYNVVGTVWCCGYQVEVGNMATNWSEYSYTQTNYGGKNLIRNTNSIDLSSNATLPNINGYYNDGSHYGNVEGGGGSLSAVEHGVKLTANGNQSIAIRFGTGTTTASLITRANGLYGLEAGETYTFSCDAKCKIGSLYSGTGLFYLGIYLYGDIKGDGTAGSANTWNIEWFSYPVQYYPGEIGMEKEAHVVFTFTIPKDAVRMMLSIRPGNNSASYVGAGDYIEMRNIKLEKGNKATDWSPAPEDIDGAVDDASKVATNYIVADSNGIKIADANPSTASTYLQLASSFLEFVRGGASMLKLWLDNSVAKIRVGAETGFNTLTDDEGIKIRNGTTVLSQFGTSLIELGKNSVAAIISLCGNKATLHYDEPSNSFQITSKKMYLISRDVESEADTSELIALNSDGVLMDVSSAEIHGGSFAKLIAGDSSTAYYASIGANAQTGIHINSSKITLTNGLYESESFSMTEAINAIPVMLYNNDSASLSGARTLSETAANFRKLTICFKSNDGSYGSVDVWNPNGKNVCLAITDMTDANPHVAYHKVKTVKINGTSIDTVKGTTYKTMQLQLGGTYTSTQVDNIGITQVIGYR